VAELVAAATEPSSEGSYGDRKARLRDAISRAHPDAVAIYAADKVVKLRELRTVIATTPDYESDQEQLTRYWASFEVLEDGTSRRRSSDSCASNSSRWPCCHPSRAANPERVTVETPGGRGIGHFESD
jgi:hypothetical protein